MRRRIAEWDPRCLEHAGKIYLPRSCLAHSFTLDEALFLACLLAVGLRPVLVDKQPVDNPNGGAATAAVENPIASGALPASNKLSYFECVAQLPDREAAARFQRGRHERRRQATPARRHPRSPL